jgi:hypothetical protein
MFRRFSLLTASVLAGGCLLYLASCSPEDLFPDDPKTKLKDTATTFTLKYTRLSDNNVDYANCYDPDGAGPESPTLLTQLKLSTNAEYDLELEVRDDTDPLRSVNYTDTISKRPGAFRVCMSSPLNLTPVPLDSDGKYPIGLKYRIKTGNAATSTLKVSLRNQTGVKDGSCDQGILMLEVNFPLRVN